MLNIKSLVASLALVTSITSTAAMADVRVEGGVSVDAGYSVGPVVRDHRTPARAPVYYAPQVRDHRAERRDWRAPTPVVLPAPQPEPTITCNPQSFSVLATEHLGGTRTNRTSTTFDMHDVRGLDQLQFGYVRGITAIEDVTVSYANGRTATYHLGDAVTPMPNHQLTRVVEVDNRAIRSITVSGWGQKIGEFSVLGKA